MSRFPSRPRTVPVGPRQALVALVVLACLAVSVIVGVAVHGSGGSGTHHAAGATVPEAASGTVATRWWSVPGAARGSRIDAHDPTAVAAGLHASRSQYCTILSQTVAAGRSVLPDVTSSDPALAVTAKAFVAELQAVAPAPVRAAWATTGTVVLELVSSRGNLRSVPRGAATGLTQAIDLIGKDSATQCHVSLAAKPGATPTGR